MQLAEGWPNPLDRRPDMIPPPAILHEVKVSPGADKAGGAFWWARLLVSDDGDGAEAGHRFHGRLDLVADGIAGQLKIVVGL